MSIHPWSKTKRELEKQGKIIKRKTGWHGWWELANIFTTTAFIEQIITALNNVSFSEVNIQASPANNGYVFSYGTWSACLTEIQSKVSGFRQFDFRFTHWKTYNSAVFDSIEMNYALTAVEKSILQIDSNTKVATVKQQVKSK